MPKWVILEEIERVLVSIFQSECRSQAPSINLCVEGFVEIPPNDMLADSGGWGAVGCQILHIGNLSHLISGYFYGWGFEKQTSLWGCWDVKWSRGLWVDWLGLGGVGLDPRRPGAGGHDKWQRDEDMSMATPTRGRRECKPMLFQVNSTTPNFTLFN